MPDFQTIPTRPTLGMGCWAIGGPFFTKGTALGWGEVDDAVSIRAIHQAIDHGLRHFDTAQVYGCGHAETLLGRALGGRSDVAIATKVGLAMDETRKELLGLETDPDAIEAMLIRSLKRLQRETIDLVLLHPNEMEIPQAAPIFERLERLREAGTIRAIGWSTDFPQKAEAAAAYPSASATEYAMNVFFRAEAMTPIVEKHGHVGLIRSPLAMGLLGGKYNARSRFGKDDIRKLGDAGNLYFKNGRITKTALKSLDAVREILRSEGRSLAQGAIAWLWARSPNALPIPGIRTPAQATDLCGALLHGPLKPEQMAEIEQVIARPPEGPPQAR